MSGGDASKHLLLLLSTQFGEHGKGHCLTVLDDYKVERAILPRSSAAVQRSGGQGDELLEYAGSGRHLTYQHD